MLKSEVGLGKGPTGFGRFAAFAVLFRPCVEIPGFRMLCVLSRCGFVSLACLWLIGCSGSVVPFTEVKRLDERVTSDELKTFLAIVDALPERKLPPFPTPFTTLPPKWNPTRTLPVGDLAQEERRGLEERWSVERLARQFTHSRALNRALRREEMTVEQFVGLMLNLGVALARESIPEERDLDDIQRRGEFVVQRLRKDNRPYSSLSDDGAHYIQQQAAWIPIIDRVQRLKLVPPENRALVQQHREKLEAIFSAELIGDPLAPFARVLDESGLPFVELPESGSDAEITWTADELLFGNDRSKPAPPEEVAGLESRASDGR